MPWIKIVSFRCKFQRYYLFVISDQESGPPKSTILSKGGILSRACDYISELRETNQQEMSLRMSRSGPGLGNENRDSDNLRLQRQVDALKTENSMLRKQVESLSKQLEEQEEGDDDPLIN